MKQFKFFASMTLLALAASCSNEEIEQSSLNMSPEEGRPAANFVLSVNENVAETRATFGNGSNGYSWYFQTGDKIGAMLMDTWDGQGEGFNNFNIVDYAHTNYPIVKNENGEWVCHEDINQLAGNYFFYFPYEPVTNARGHFGFSINPNQPQYNDAGELDYWKSVEENQRYIGYNFVPVGPYTGEATEVKVDFAPLFAMPAFEFTNKAGDLIVDKIVVRATSDLTADMYDKEKNMLMATTMAFLPGSAGFNNVKGQWKNDGVVTTETNILWDHAIMYTSGVGLSEKYQLPTGAKNWEPGTKPFYALNASVGDTYAKQSPAYEYVADYSGVEGGYIVNQYGKVRAILVMPAGSYAVDGFEAMLHVRPVNAPEDRYVVRLPLDLETTTSDDIGDAAGHNFLVPGKTSKFYANFDAAAMKSYDITKSQITSSEDLLWMVEEAEKYTGNYTLVVNTSGNRVELTKEIEEKLAAKPNVKLYVNGKITIAADASGNAINLLNYDDDNVTTDLTVLNEQKATKEIKNCGTITVEKDGAIKGGKNITADNLINKGVVEAGTINAIVANNGTINAVTVNGNVTNSGTVNATTINGEVENKADANLTVGTVNGDIYNYGTAKVTVLANGTVRNWGTMEVKSIPMGKAWSNKAGTLTFTGSNTYGDNGANKQGATLVISGNSKIYYMTNAGTVNVSADTELMANCNNVGTINVAEGKSLKGNGKGLQNYGTINVEGKLENEIYNGGLINVKKNGLVIVNNTVAEAEITVEVKDNVNKTFAATAGIIDVTEANDGTAAQAAKCISSEDMYFRYTVSETAAKNLAAALKTRISEQNYNVNPIILVWAANSPANFAGTELDDSNVNTVIINRDLTLTANTRFQDAEYVTINSLVTVGNGNSALGFNCGAAEVTVNGSIKVNNHGGLSGAATYVGAGTIHMVGADSRLSWTEGATWTGKLY